MSFRLVQCRYQFRAQDAVRFATGTAGNLFRGALGLLLREVTCSASCPGARTCPDAARCSYARCFEPRQLGAGPSGFADLPRPFVLRAAELDGLAIDPGGEFTLTTHLFDLSPELPELFARALSRLEWEGIGPGRARVSLLDVETSTIEVPLINKPAHSIRIAFRSPTELKSEGRVVEEPSFPVLFTRARDRVSQLRELYQGGPLDIDFRELGERSRDVRLVESHLQHQSTQRHSSRTGQRHELGGFTGEVRYEGDLGEFLPILRAASYTGVGRHTVWGLGAFEIVETT